ncbi:unnamed protein product [Bursaphelenchus xylophilus]|uniref:Hexosyltransferase n=1 Tax=Bursaphelenchus xylophilus TaxID=6326 RepID=A0A1I7SAQ3_BURXY|nr:unnamed protein product [Bursaphelenchus xylophilus]CAG9126893.1 unnamed protein product [Bursaphelenchus xylophilus]
MARITLFGLRYGISEQLHGATVVRIVRLISRRTWSIFGIFFALFFFYNSFGGDNVVLSGTENLPELGPVEINAKFRNDEFSYVLHPPIGDDFCKHIDFFIIVFSKPDNYEQRDRIRYTWSFYKNMARNFTVKFIIGNVSDVGLSMKLQQEAEVYVDILRYNYTDTPKDNEVKLHAALNYHLNYCPNATYIIKTTDDTVLDVRRIWHYTNNLYTPMLSHSPELIVCNAKTYTNRKDLLGEGKHYIPKNGYVKRPVKFCDGGTFIATKYATKALLSKTEMVNRFPSDDVLYTGYLLTKTNARIIDQDIFGQRSDMLRQKCDYYGVPPTFAQRGADAEVMMDVFNKLKSVRCLPSFNATLWRTHFGNA